MHLNNLNKNSKLDRIKKSLPFLLFIALGAFPSLPVNSRSILVIACSLIFLYSLVARKKKETILNHLNLIYISLPLLLFLLYGISYFYSTNKDIALFSLEKRLSLIAFPFIAWAGTKFPQIKYFKLSVLFLFIISCYFLTIKIIPHIEPNQLISNTAGSIEAVFALRNKISSITHLHPTYLNIYLLFSCLILIELILQSRQKNYPISFGMLFFYLLTILIFLVFSSITAARTPLFSFIITLVLRLLLSKIPVAFKASFILLLAGGITTAFLFIPSLNNRIRETFNTKLEAPKGIHHNSTNIRVGIYQCAIETIQDNWLIGAGAGDSQATLGKCYEQFDTPVYKQNKYNTHNQYFGVWLDTGVLGFLILSGLLGFGLFLGLKTNSYLQVSFFCFMAINMLTENILATQAGIMFFMYFYAFFYLNNFSTKSH